MVSSRSSRFALILTEDRVLTGIFSFGIRANQCSEIVIFDQFLKFFAECSPLLDDARISINQQ